jgi:hypothetical protein
MNINPSIIFDLDLRCKINRFTLICNAYYNIKYEKYFFTKDTDDMPLYFFDLYSIGYQNDYSSGNGEIKIFNDCLENETLFLTKTAFKCARLHILQRCFIKIHKISLYTKPTELFSRISDNEILP